MANPIAITVRGYHSQQSQLGTRTRSADMNAVVVALAANLTSSLNAVLEPEVTIKDSANVAALGENTTVQLTAPAGKTTADFGGGRIQDDRNPGDAVDLASGEYREDEWCLKLHPLLQGNDTYQFRVVLSDDTPLATYDQTPQLTITGPQLINTLTADMGAIVQRARTLTASMNAVVVALAANLTSSLNAVLEPEVTIKDSANVAALGENTTVQLTAPAGKTTADFGGGRIQDDRNPGDAVNLASGEYREDEWCIQVHPDIPDSTVFEFRVVLSDGSEFLTYDQTPQLSATSQTNTLTASMDGLLKAENRTRTSSLNGHVQDEQPSGDSNRPGGLQTYIDWDYSDDTTYDFVINGHNVIPDTDATAPKSPSTIIKAKQKEGNAAGSGDYPNIGWNSKTGGSLGAGNDTPMEQVYVGLWLYIPMNENPASGDPADDGTGREEQEVGSKILYLTWGGTDSTSAVFSIGSEWTAGYVKDLTGGGHLLNPTTLLRYAAGGPMINGTKDRSYYYNTHPNGSDWFSISNITLDEWHFVEFFWQLNSLPFKVDTNGNVLEGTPDGTFKAWVDNALQVEDYEMAYITDVDPGAGDSHGFETVKHANIWGGTSGTKTRDSWFYYDHVIIAGTLQ